MNRLGRVRQSRFSEQLKILKKLNLAIFFILELIQVKDSDEKKLEVGIDNFF